MNNDFLAIDELALDKECIKQPQLYFTYAQKATDARRDLDEAKADQSVLAAELNKKIRSNPQKYGLSDKPTEASINTTVTLQKEYRDAEAVVIEAAHKLGIMSAAVTAMEHRKRALTLLVNLKGQEYYSEPSTSAAGKKAVNEDVKRSTRTLGQRKVSKADDEEDGE